MRNRGAWLVVMGLMSGIGAFADACSSSSGGGFGVDSGADATADQATDRATPPDQGADVSSDTSVPDTLVPPTDAGNDTATSDASSDTTDGVAPEASGDSAGPPPVDAGPLANCSPVNGPACDIVTQNCPVGYECIVVAALDGGATTGCSQDLGSEHLARGTTCCPSQTNPCAPELECIGSPCSADASAPKTGRCAPHCCLGPDGGDNTPCGSSVPEGYPGQCELNITDSNSNVLYAVCTYDPTCIPLGVEPCASTFGCLVQDMSGAASCTQILGADGGASLGFGEGQACSFGNECADGLMCLAMGDGGFACTWLCDVAGQAPPFDAGALTAQPGHGGCPVSEQCFAATQLFPPWLGVCTP